MCVCNIGILLFSSTDSALMVPSAVSSTMSSLGTFVDWSIMICGAALVLLMLTSSLKRWSWSKLAGNSSYTSPAINNVPVWWGIQESRNVKYLTICIKESQSLRQPWSLDHARTTYSVWLPFFLRLTHLQDKVYN